MAESHCAQGSMADGAARRRVKLPFDTDGCNKQSFVPMSEERSGGLVVVAGKHVENLYDTRSLSISGDYAAVTILRCCTA